MTSSNLEKKLDFFTHSESPYEPPGEEEAVVILAGVRNIKLAGLPKEEHMRADSMTSQHARGRYLAARSLVRRVLSGWLNREPDSIPISITPEGKPFVIGEEMPKFSVSHTHDFIAAAFFHSSVGIDLEKERPVDALFLARRFFSDEEVDHLERTKSPSDFFKLWTCREAAIKGDGRGMAALLSKIKIASPESGAEGPLQVAVEEVSWSAFHWKLQSGIHGAVAFRKVPGLIRWCDLR
jgi:4'-phosphopantetheinyl transferase